MWACGRSDDKSRSKVPTRCRCFAEGAQRPQFVGLYSVDPDSLQLDTHRMAEISQPYAIAGRLVDPSLNRITTAANETVQVEPKVMQVLAALAERPGEVVTRDELMARVWNGVFVTDDALHRAIRELRRVFDDSAEAPRVIETIRKRGYRLIAPIEPSARASGNGSAINSENGAGKGSGVETGYAAAPWSELVAALAVGAIAVAAVVHFERAAWIAPEQALGVEFLPMTSEPGNE